MQPVKAGGQRREAGWQPSSGPEPFAGEARVEIPDLRQQRKRRRLRNHHVGIVGELLLLQTGIGDTDRQPHQHQRPETVNLLSAQGRVPGIALDQRRHGLDWPDLAAGQIGPGDGQITDPGVEQRIAEIQQAREPWPLPRFAHSEQVMQVQVVVDRLPGQRGKRCSSGTVVPVQQRAELAFQVWFAVEKGKMRADPVRRAQVPFEAPFERGVAEVGQRRMHPGDRFTDFRNQVVRQAMMIEGGAGQQSQSPDQTLFAVLIRATGDQIAPSRGQDFGHGHALDRL